MIELCHSLYEKNSYSNWIDLLGILIAYSILSIVRRPSNDRNWNTDQAILPIITIDGDTVNIKISATSPTVPQPTTHQTITTLPTTFQTLPVSGLPSNRFFRPRLVPPTHSSHLNLATDDTWQFP